MISQKYGVALLGKIPLTTMQIRETSDDGKPAVASVDSVQKNTIKTLQTIF